MTNIVVGNGTAELLVSESMHPIISRKDLEKVGGTIRLYPDKENPSESEFTGSWIHASVSPFVPRSFARFLKRNSDKFIAYAFRERSESADAATVLIVPYCEDSKIGFSVINDRGSARFDTAIYYRFVTIDIYKTQKGDNYDISEYWDDGEDDVASGECFLTDFDTGDVWYSRRASRDFRTLKQRLEKWYPSSSLKNR